ncbi:peroxisome membrane protein [Backusella circina FSU 941]|nr:peroxisome membrane protein [Backusella circina FSU 941]
MNILNKYEHFLLKNASQISSIEASLRTLTYILPGRFHDAEFASQALYAALNLLGLYHTSILKKAISVQARDNIIEESSFNKYLGYWTKKSKLTSATTTLLSVISYTQVLVEMAILKKWGKRRQWLGVTYLEAIKLILRLILFQSTQQRMTLQPTHLKRDVDPSTLNNNNTKGHQVAIYHRDWIGQRSGNKVPLLATTIHLDNNNGVKGAYNSVTDYLLSKVLTPEKVRRPEQMVQIQRHSLAKMGELLYIARPFIYVLSILRWGRMSWRPWIISLITELTSQFATRKGYQGKHRTTMLPLEKDEYNRRLNLILLNTMRGAFYSRVTRPRLERFCNATETKPVFSILSGVLRDYMHLWQDIYFYTSAS